MRLEIIGKMVRVSSTVVGFNNNLFVKVGGRSESLSVPSLNIGTSGIGGMESAVLANTLYYVYVVRSGLTVGLIASTSSLKPSVYKSYRKVGAFYTNNISEVVFAFGFLDNFSTEAKTFTPSWDSMPTLGYNEGVYYVSSGYIYGTLNIIASASNGVASSIIATLPDNLRFDPAKISNNLAGSTANSGDVVHGAWYDQSSDGLNSLVGTDAPTTGITIRRANSGILSDFNGSSVQSGDRVNLFFKLPLLGLSGTLDWNNY